jgi:hypothetical protein
MCRKNNHKWMQLVFKLRTETPTKVQPNKKKLFCATPAWLENMTGLT